MSLTPFIAKAMAEEVSDALVELNKLSPSEAASSKR